MKAIKHFKTITKHKFYVMKLCFRFGLYKQGLLHDLSKYTWSEFATGAKYYLGYNLLTVMKEIRLDIAVLGYIIRVEINIIGNIGLILQVKESLQLKCQLNM